MNVKSEEEVTAKSDVSTRNKLVTWHRVYIFSMGFVVFALFLYLTVSGISFYEESIEERFFHPDYMKLKPSGSWGHGLGILGSLSMIIGVSTYMIRKRNRRVQKLGVLKHWLEFHIFLCTLGPMLVLYHTSFKFGGLVAVSFWSMVAVFISGIIGRFIYIRIPHNINGKELSVSEVRKMNAGLDQATIERKIERLKLMQNLFRYWHVAHLPFAFIMLIIMLIHVAVTITFGYRWVF